MSFFENALKALKQFFFAGLQGWQLFLVLVLELYVNGLLLKDRQPHISKVNKYLPDNSHISVSFHGDQEGFIRQAKHIAQRVGKMNANTPAQSVKIAADVIELVATIQCREA